MVMLKDLAELHGSVTVTFVDSMLHTCVLACGLDDR